MPLTEKEQGLLKNATAYLPEDFRKFLIEHVTAMVEEQSGFRKKFFHVLKHGLIFRIDPKGGSVAHYSAPQNTMFFGSPYFISDIPIIVARAYLSMMLRHEVTHADDFLVKNDSDVNILRLNTTFLRANLLFNALGCINRNIKRNNVLNLEMLDKLTPHMIDYNTTGQIYTLYSEKKADIFLQKFGSSIISSFGSFLIPNALSSTLNIYKYRNSDGHYAMLKSSDMALIHERFVASNATRQLNPDNIEMDHYLKRLINILTWISIDFGVPYRKEERHKTLDALYAIRERITVTVVQEQSCFPAFISCVQDNKDNCLNSFISCQMLNPSKDIVAESCWEVRAALEERSNWYLFDLNVLQGLCQPNNKSNRVTREAPAISSFDTSETSLLPHTFAYSAGFSFVNDLMQAIVKKQGYQHKECIFLVVNMGYVLSMKLFSIL